MDLPDELLLEVLQYVEPMRDTAAVSLVCRRWQEIALDPHLWCRYFLTHFPTHHGPLPNNPSDDRPLVAQQPWRDLFIARAATLKKDLAHIAYLFQSPYPCLCRKRRGEHAPPIVVLRTLAAAKAGCFPLATRWALEAGEDVMTITLEFIERGRTYWRSSSHVRAIDECLIRACLTGSIPTAEVFLRMGANVNSGRQELSPLAAAASSGNSELVALLLHLDPSTSSPYWNLRSAETALKTASEEGYVEIVSLLLEHRPLAAISGLERAIERAALFGRVDVLRLLLPLFQCTNPVLPPYGWRPTRSGPYSRWLMTAIERGDKTMTALFLQHGLVQVRRDHIDAWLMRSDRSDVEMLSMLTQQLDDQEEGARNRSV